MIISIYSKALHPYNSSGTNNCIYSTALSISNSLEQTSVFILKHVPLFILWEQLSVFIPKYSLLIISWDKHQYLFQNIFHVGTIISVYSKTLSPYNSWK